MKAMIFAAGLGTRLKPLTDTMPKALVSVGGKPLLQTQIERLKAAGCSEIVINVHHFAAQIVRFVAEHASFGVNIMFSPELKTLLDTGGGIKRAVPLLKPNAAAKDEFILIHNVDILSDLNINEWVTDCLKAHEEQSGHDDESQSGPVAYLLVSDRNTQRYLLFDADDRLVGWMNVSTGEVRSPYPSLNVAECRKLAFSGIHLFSTSLFPLFDDYPDKFSIIDFYLDICNRMVVKGVTVPNLHLIDVGKYEMMAQADTFVRNLNR